MTTLSTITGTVDEHGRTTGFSLHESDDDGAGSFGDGLSPGDIVLLDDGREAEIEKVHTYIQSGRSGDSNFVAVVLRVIDDE